MSLKKCFFIQVTEPAGYPPLKNSSRILADLGWQIKFLTAPSKGKIFRIPTNANVEVVEMPLRDNYRVTAFYYLLYCLRAILITFFWRPKILYVSDPIGCPAGFLASLFSGVKVIYHEHDSPNSEMNLNLLIRIFRRKILRASHLIIFPNSARAEIVRSEITFDISKVQIVWNTPIFKRRLDSFDKQIEPFILYYHGNLSPELLPTNLLKVIAEYKGRVQLWFAGYEAPGYSGYLDKIISELNSDGQQLAHYFGVMNYDDLLKLASRCHLGLALIPSNSANINLKHIMGASNKVFDYLSAGLPLLVSDKSDFKESILDNGLGISCCVESPESIRKAIDFYFKNDFDFSAFSIKATDMIEKYWNYELQFQKVVMAINKF